MELQNEGIPAIEEESQILEREVKKSMYSCGF